MPSIGLVGTDAPAPAVSHVASEAGRSEPSSSAGPQDLQSTSTNTAASSAPSPPLSSPSFPTPSSRSNAASQLSPRTPTTASTSVNTHPVLHPNLPSPLSPEQTAQARAALVGTISNLLDSELQSRASLLHSNAAALERQERDVAKATEALRRENDKLIKVVKEGSKKVLETGNVQNWAEVLERDFLVLEDTMRRVRDRGSDAGCSDPDCSGCSYGSGSWSGSRTPSRRGGLDGGSERRGEVADGRGEDGAGKGKAAEQVIAPADGDRVGAGERMEVDESAAPPEPQEQEGAFASVNNAIAASITEAMATSIDDFHKPPPPPMTDPEPQGSLAMVAETDGDRAEPQQTVPAAGSPVELSVDMELDNDEQRTQDEQFTSMDDRRGGPQAGVSTPQGDPETSALESLGLVPEAAFEGLEGSAKSDSATTETTANVPTAQNGDSQPGAATDEDKMDVDAEASTGEQPAPCEPDHVI